MIVHHREIEQVESFGSWCKRNAVPMYPGEVIDEGELYAAYCDEVLACDSFVADAEDEQPF